MYQKYVISPSNRTELTDLSREFSLAGLPGCIGSTDATHIIMECCSFKLRQLHLGYKSTHTSCTYNLTVNHRRRILSTTTGHPSRFNDQTLILFDKFVRKLKDGKYDSDFEFEFYDFDNNGEVILVKYRGCYVIVDNGYLSWSVTVPPIKLSTSRSEICFSEWLESLWKDVECTFGILKGRFCILRYGIRLWGLDKTDQLWMTCCALHNRLLEVDGLCEGWENGVRSNWETDVDDENDLPFALRRLKNPSKERTYDTSSMGVGPDCQKTPDQDNDCLYIASEKNLLKEFSSNDETVVSVNKLPLQIFRKKLITHFNIAFQRNELVWPKRNENKNN